MNSSQIDSEEKENILKLYGEMRKLNEKEELNNDDEDDEEFSVWQK